MIIFSIIAITFLIFALIASIVLFISSIKEGEGFIAVVAGFLSIFIIILAISLLPRKCPSCDKWIMQEKYCGYCGYELVSPSWTCDNCKTSIHASYDYCLKCGAKRNEKAE